MIPTISEMTNGNGGEAYVVEVIPSGSQMFCFM